MTEQQRYCMRCARPAVRGDSDTEEIWRCPTQHGIVYRAALPEAQTATLPDEPDEEEDTEQHEDDAEDKEDARPEARARAPAVHHRPPAKKKPVKAAKRK